MFSQHNMELIDSVRVIIIVLLQLLLATFLPNII